MGRVAPRLLGRRGKQRLKGWPPLNQSDGRRAENTETPPGHSACCPVDDPKLEEASEGTGQNQECVLGNLLCGDNRVGVHVERSEHIAVLFLRSCVEPHVVQVL
jgi:hypothetical protein